ncbi:hypothetical protein D3C85_596670 [compost metagenome]
MQLVEAFQVAYAQHQEVVELARHQVAFQAAADAARRFLEVGEGIRRGAVQHHPHDDQRGHVDLGGFQQRDRFFDDAFGLQLFHAPQAGRGTQVNARAEIQVGDLRVVLQDAKNVPVDTIQSRKRGHLMRP